MSDIAVRVKDVSKRYKLNVLTRHNTLRDEIAHGVRSLVRKNRGSRSPTESESTLWAVKDVSFDVRQGEVLGIIGRNGAGKSTLLKILSRITEPTSGRCEIFGRLGSLLEVGTGFHGELTGRENVYLNGAILGMRKAEIERRFDEIVAFAEVEQFIDMPVKRYSSGMHVRLAFAVAAHLQPEILIIDEVLAVGDQSFQNKCLGKLGSVAREGRTVLFVSHNLAAVTNLCTAGIWIERGHVQMRGDAKSVIEAYMKASSGSARELRSRNGENSSEQRNGSGEARFVDAKLLDSINESRSTFVMGESIFVEFEVEFARSFPWLHMSVDVKRSDSGLPVLHLLNHDSGTYFENLPKGTHRFTVEVPNCMLYPGSYSVSLFAAVPGNQLDHVEDVVAFSMIQSGISKRPSPFYSHLAVYHSPSIWHVQ